MIHGTIFNNNFQRNIVAQKIDIIIIYSGYPFHRSVFQWGPEKYDTLSNMASADDFNAIFVAVTCWITLNRLVAIN